MPHPDVDMGVETDVVVEDLTRLDVTVEVVEDETLVELAIVTDAVEEEVLTVLDTTTEGEVEVEVLTELTDDVEDETRLLAPQTLVAETAGTMLFFM